MAYEGISRARSIPLVGKPIFGILDTSPAHPVVLSDAESFTQHVPGGPAGILRRQGTLPGDAGPDRSRRTFPVVTSFFAPAIAADKKTSHRVFCIICDADLNRVWVATGSVGEPHLLLRTLWQGRAASPRVRCSGREDPSDRLSPPGRTRRRTDMTVAAQHARTSAADPRSRMDGSGPCTTGTSSTTSAPENCMADPHHVLTITFAVGGAGAQKEIGARIVASLRHRIKAGAIRLNLLAGTRAEVRDYLLCRQRCPRSRLRRICRSFTQTRSTSTLRCSRTVCRTRTSSGPKPSELSFYAALGIADHHDTCHRFAGEVQPEVALRDRCGDEAGESGLCG